MKILLSCFACDPTRGSECFVGWNWATQVYAGVPKIVLTRSHHRAELDKQDVADTTFAYFDLPFCRRLSHHNPMMKVYYIAWQFAVLPYAMYLAFSRQVTVVQHLTYNTLDFPGALWMIPGTDFIWGSVGGGQVPPLSLSGYYGADWQRQRRRMFVKRMSWANPFLRLALLRARLVFAANTDTLRILERLIPDPGRLHRILETAIHAAGPPRTLRPGRVRIVWIGRFEPRKAPRLAIEIARRIEQLAPGRFTLRMIGEGEMWQAVHDFAAGDANVSVDPPVPFSEMPRIYRESDILLFTSLQDTSGNVVLESMAQGIPRPRARAPRSRGHAAGRRRSSGATGRGGRGHRGVLRRVARPGGTGILRPGLSQRSDQRGSELPMVHEAGAGQAAAGRHRGHEGHQRAGRGGRAVVNSGRTRRQICGLGAWLAAGTAARAMTPAAGAFSHARPRFLRRGPLRGVAVTPPNYRAAASADNPPHYQRPPYAGRWDSQNYGFPLARRRAAAAAGLDTVRIMLDAGPFMDARTSGAVNTLPELLGYMMANVRHFVSAGFRVVLNYNAELRTPNPAFSRAAILDGPSGPNFTAYCAGLAEVCRAVASAFAPEEVAVEIINEPLFDWEWGERAPWSVQAPAMWAAARAASPHHTLVVQSGSAGYYRALAALDPSQFDGNTLFSFHPYDPGGFTHQGIGENVGLYRVPFPLEPGLQWDEAVALMQDRVAAQPDLLPEAKTALVQHNIAELRNMFDAAFPLGPARMDRDWGAIDAWLAQHGMRPEQVIAGEFGATSDFNYNGSLGCDSPSRARYYRAVRENVEKRGFGGWIAWQSVGDFNLFEQTSVHEHGDALLAPMADALGLRPASEAAAGLAEGRADTDMNPALTSCGPGRTWLMRASALVIIVFPFNAYLPELVFLALILGSCGMLLAARRYPRPPAAFVASAAVVFVYLFVALISGRSVGACMSTSAHMVQLILCTYAFYTAFYNGVFEEEKLGWFVIPLVLAHINSVALTMLSVGSWDEDRPAFTEHNTLTFFTVFLLMSKIDARRGRWPVVILVAYMVGLALFTDRFSVHALSLCVVALTFVRLPPVLIATVSAVIIIYPIFFALTASGTELIAMANADLRNAFIRVEFMRSAAYLFSQDLVRHLFIGMGFGTDFRTVNFNYVRPHPLLIDPEKVASTSNHHSIFDVYFRFGLIFGTVFLWPIVRQFYIASRSLAPKAGIFFLAFGMSFNAYLDNELEVSLVSFILALLLREQYLIRQRRRAPRLHPSMRTVPPPSWPPPIAPGGTGYGPAT